MITDSFDNGSPAILNPKKNESAPKADACILTFSYLIEKTAIENYGAKEIAALHSASGTIPIYAIEHNGKTIAFFKTTVGAPAAVGFTEEAAAEIDCKKFVLFGGAGCLDKEIARGKVMVPTEAYRDEGTSYHYAPAADYIKIENAPVVAEFMKQNGIPFVMGKTWTTDAFYRETRNNFEKRKADGCLSVEMECAGMQAMCDFRDLKLYAFFTSGDLLDAPEWDARVKPGQIKHTQHDAGHFDIAFALADYVAGL